MDRNGLYNNLGIQVQRRKRIEKLKAILLVILAIWVVFSIVSIVFMSARLYSQDKWLDVLQEKQKIVEEYIKADREKKTDTSEVKADHNKNKSIEAEYV